MSGYRVFLDVECIRGGSDWQDVLNDAVSNCSVFVPLITQQYGQVETLSTLSICCVAILLTKRLEISVSLEVYVQAHIMHATS